MQKAIVPKIIVDAIDKNATKDDELTIPTIIKRIIAKNIEKSAWTPVPIIVAEATSIDFNVFKLLILFHLYSLNHSFDFSINSSMMICDEPMYV